MGRECGYVGILDGLPRPEGWEDTGVQDAFLVLLEAGQETRRVAIGEVAVLGRAEDCDLSVADASASRRHAEIQRTPSGFLLRDLGSLNGTLLNGELLAEVENLEGTKLHPGDRITIGGCVIEFECDDPTLMASPIQNSGELLRAVHSVMNDIASNFDPCSLLDSVLKTTMRAVNGQRGAILFRNEATGECDVCACCGAVHQIREGHLSRIGLDSIHISQTVARRVLDGGESMLFEDTGAEADRSASMVTLQLRSIMCVPLRSKSGVLGILYVDSNRSDMQYTEEHLRLCTTVGASAGLAIENVRMHGQILQKQRMEQEIEHAWTIQQGFLIRHWPQGDPRFEAFGEMHPAEAVGGDFYDLVQPDADTVGLLVGDVSGKGVPASLTMAQVLAEFRVHARTERSPARVLAALNEDLCERSQRGMFCSLCYCTLNLRTGQVVCANAGHHPPIHIREGEPTEQAPPSGPPIGILAESRWADVGWQLEPNDAVLLYTDGVVEARLGVARTAAGTHEEFGLNGVYDVLRRNEGKGSQALVSAVLSAVMAYSLPLSPHDDCTLLALRYLSRG